MKILVLGGGDSPEREVSLRSAHAVSAAARQAGFEVQEADPANGLTVLDNLLPDTVIFPILHGVGGEDGVIQKEFENRKLAFLGAGSDISALCFDKWQSRLVFSTAGLPIAKGELVTRATYADSTMISEPHVLKVLRGGSSIGTLMVREPAKLDRGEVDKIFQLDNDAVLEELVEGTEITVPILDQSALPVIEIHPPDGLEFDYENKYNGLTAEICPAESVDRVTQATAQRVAEKVHKTVGCRHLSRVDMIIRPSGEMVVLEINTVPGLTDQSLYPKSAAVAGLPMPKLVGKFAEMVVRDYNL